MKNLDAVEKNKIGQIKGALKVGSACVEIGDQYFSELSVMHLI
jgi:hypothetical protein